MFRIDASGRLIRRFGGETLCIQAWGESALRVRAVQYGCDLEGRDGALTDQPEGRAQIVIDGDTATITSMGRFLRLYSRATVSSSSCVR